MNVALCSGPAVNQSASNPLGKKSLPFAFHSEACGKPL